MIRREREAEILGASSMPGGMGGKVTNTMAGIVREADLTIEEFKKLL